MKTWFKDNKGLKISVIVSVLILIIIMILWWTTDLSSKWYFNLIKDVSVAATITLSFSLNINLTISIKSDKSINKTETNVGRDLVIGNDEKLNEFKSSVKLVTTIKGFMKEAYDNLNEYSHLLEGDLNAKFQESYFHIAKKSNHEIEKMKVSLKENISLLSKDNGRELFEEIYELIDLSNTIILKSLYITNLKIPVEDISRHGLTMLIGSYSTVYERFVKLYDESIPPLVEKINH